MRENNDKSVQITLLRNELIYDIENNAYIHADAIKEDGSVGAHKIMDIAQDGNVDRVNRILDLAFDECKDYLYPYTKEIDYSSSSDSTKNDIPEGNNMYLLNMTVPFDFAEGTVSLIKNLVHEYMVCRVLADWLSFTHKDTAQTEVWLRKLQTIPEKLSACTTKRYTRVRRTQTPF